MVFYTFFFLIVFSTSNIKKIKLGKLFLIEGWSFSFLLLFIFSSLRFDVGYDYSMYYGLIDGNIRWFTDQINRIEYLPRQLILLSKEIHFYQLFFAVTSFLILYLFHRGIKNYSSDKQTSLLLFFCFPFFFFLSLSVVRQFVAVALLFYAFKYIKERKIITYFIFVFLAFLFHKSAILALPIYFLYGDFIINRKFILLIFILSFVSSDFIAFLIKVSSSRYSIYITQIGGEGGKLILTLMKIIGIFLLPIVYNLKDRFDKDFNFFLVTFYLGIFFWSSLSKFGHAGMRSSLYFLSFFLLLVPKLKFKIKEYYIVKQVLFLFLIALYFGNLYVGSNHRIKDPNMPYQTYFFKSMKDLKPDQ